ncbi:MAG: cytochrome c family protein [Bacteroidetes bacterium]|nr:cytochrome c family protein [Bacteroidota bacterium]MBU1114346.1 cytochrome c family protein [Bacteroidota bacterium]MBU1797124.1 cytochrome c family protein [Bacteroidota bacterium]
MKKIATSSLILFIISIFTFSTILAQGKSTYIGAKKCGMCHKKDDGGKQLKIWEGSKHSQAFKTLQTAEADKIAAEKGFKTKAAETPECLKCHVTGADLDAKMLDKGFKIEDGVQCETCHGAGSEYKAKKIMEDHAASVANGLTEFKDEAAIKAFCETCHNSNSPTFKSFDFAKSWDKIKHPVPKK